MSEQKQESSGVIVKIVGERMFFPALFKKDKYDRHSANFAMDPGGRPLHKVLEYYSDSDKQPKAEAALKKAAADGSNYAKVVLAILQAAQAKWGKKYIAVLKSLVAKNDVCLRDGDLKPDTTGYPGNYILSAVNYSRPTLLTRNRDDVIKEEGSLLYSGSHPIAVVEIWAQDNQAKGWKRVNCQLQGVQEYKPGEKIGGGRVAKKDEFDDLGDPDEPQASDDDLVGGGDDDNPF